LRVEARNTQEMSGMALAFVAVGNLQLPFADSVPGIVELRTAPLCRILFCNGVTSSIFKISLLA
jgi:hypothetical protein